MSWKLSDNWMVARDPYNWVLLRKSGRSWKKTYYASPEQLLKSLYRRVSRTIPPQPDLVEHLEACLKIASTFYRRFHDVTGVCPRCGQKTARKTRGEDIASSDEP